MSSSHRGSWFTDLYLVWLIGFSVVGIIWPDSLNWFKGPWVVSALTLVMLGMGFTLTIDDFRRIFKMPGSLAMGFVAHYTIMPLSGWAVARLLNLDPAFAVGLILVASCPSGTASNVISFLARANVALAVMVTLTSTLLAFILTPLWCKSLAGAYIPVNATKLCLSTLQVAVAPVLIGVFCNWKFPKAVAKVSRFGPVVSVFAILFITGGIVSLNASAVIANAGKLALAALLLHLLGFGVGYMVARVLGYSEDIVRTISIEVGMQNGGLAAVLARENFPNQPMTAVPAVFSAVIQNVVGSAVATWWQKHPPKAVTANAVHPRSTIYYWKCDRPAAFHGTGEHLHRDSQEARLCPILEEWSGGKAVLLSTGAGQGNHITWNASIGEQELFVRIEDGPEHDDYIEVESRILSEVRSLGVPAPQVHAVDASRSRVPFAWQLLEKIPCPDLNSHYKEGRIQMPEVAHRIGSDIARWQALQPPGFGLFDPATLRKENRLQGFHSTYGSYFLCHLDRHLQFLVERQFLSQAVATEIKGTIDGNRSLLDLKQGCLVHKDLALWNILGTPTEIAAYIDWDDAISGDPMDDLSLLACFHDAKTVEAAFAGYASARPLPPDHLRRFWLHLLRNMIVKSVIRVGAGYFDRSDSFFLINAGDSGQNLRDFTLSRLNTALSGLRENKPLSTL